MPNSTDFSNYTMWNAPSDRDYLERIYQEEEAADQEDPIGMPEELSDEVEKREELCNQVSGVAKFCCSVHEFAEALTLHVSKCAVCNPALGKPTTSEPASLPQAQKEIA